MSSQRQAQYNDLARYFQSVSRTNMMTPAEETEIACLWRDTGKQEYADRLASANLRFVIKIALEYKNYGFPILDLIQEGNVGLVRAVKSFDPDKGFRLISYAVWWIRAYIQEYILKNWSLVKMGTTQLQRRLFNHLQSSQKRLKQLVGTTTEQERREKLAEAVGGSVRDVEEMERRLYGRDLSIDASRTESSNSYSLHERLTTEEHNAEDLLEAAQSRRVQRRELRRALSVLGDRERYIVESRHLNEDTTTLRQLGEELGISKERVRQLEVRALATLRDSLLTSTAVAESF